MSLIKKRIVRAIALGIGLIFGGGLFVFLIWQSGVDDIWNSLKTFGFAAIVGFVSLSLLNFCLYTGRWKIILDTMLPKGARVPFHRLFLHRMSGFAAGYLTPAAQVAGEPIRVAMLRTENVPLKEATSSVVLDLAFEITSFVMYVTVGLAFAFSQGLGGGESMVLSLIFVSTLLLVMVAFFAATITGNGFFFRVITGLRLDRWKMFADGKAWLQDTEKLMSRFFAGRRVLVIKVIILSFVMSGFKAVEAVYISHFLGVNVEITEAFLLSTLPGISLLLPVPAGLGVYEGSNATLFAVLGLPLNPIAYTAIIRVRDFCFIAIGVGHAISSGERLVYKDYAKRT